MPAASDHQKPAGQVLLKECSRKMFAGELLTSGSPSLVSGQTLQPGDNLSSNEIAYDTVDSVPTANGHNGDDVDNDVVDSSHMETILAQYEARTSYDMSRKERGCFLIFNQEDFNSSLGLNSRTTTHGDAEKMFRIAQHMGFEFVRIFNNLQKSEIFDWLKAVSQCKHDIYDCFGCAILTYSDEDGALYARDGGFNLSECAAFFSAQNCPELAGKPKLFFLQACQVSKKQAKPMSSSKKTTTTHKGIAATLPNEIDFFLACSTIPGFTTLRNNCNGSWFIQSLHHCINQYARSMTLNEIMNRVNHMVACCQSSNNPKSCEHETSFFISQLTGEVYFYKEASENVCLECSSQLQSAVSSKEDVQFTADKSSAGSSKSFVAAERESKQRMSIVKRIRQSFRRGKGRK